MALRRDIQLALAHTSGDAQLSVSGANTVLVLFNMEDIPSETFVQSARGLHTTIEWEGSSMGRI